MALSSAASRISEMVETEIQKALNEKLTKYVEYVSQRYDISLTLLMHDLENLDNLSLSSPIEFTDLKDGKCKGVKPCGKRCGFRAKQSGYCNRHLDQKRVERPPITPSQPIPNMVAHNHSFSECLFKIDCPACEKSKRVSSKENLLIDL